MPPKAPSDVSINSSTAAAATTFINWQFHCAYCIVCFRRRSTLEPSWRQYHGYWSQCWRFRLRRRWRQRWPAPADDWSATRALWVRPWRAVYRRRGHAVAGADCRGRTADRRLHEYKTSAGPHTSSQSPHRRSSAPGTLQYTPADTTTAQCTDEYRAN